MKVIAIRYTKGRFLIDLLATIPFDLISLIFTPDDNNGLLFQSLGLLKLFRILRLSRLITLMNLKDDVKMSLKLVRLLFFLILYLHFVS
jgi:hypothetical protein